MQFYYLTLRRFSKSVQVPPKILYTRLIVFHSRTRPGTHVHLGTTPPQSPSVGAFPVLVCADLSLAEITGHSTSQFGSDWYFLMIRWRWRTSGDLSHRDAVPAAGHRL